MKASLVLVFLAVANAAAYFDAVVFGYDGLAAPVSPLLTRAMFHHFGLSKPALDGRFVSFARSLGASDPIISRMYSLYDEPAVMMFMDRTGGVVSYYADAGIENAILSPELRSVFPSVLGAADSMAIVYHPESFLGSYRSVLPGHFFVPSDSAMLVKAMRSGIDALPLPIEHVIFKRPEIADIFPEVSPIYAKFDIDEFPIAYKSPVAFKHVDHPVGYPSSSVFAKSALHGYGVSNFNPFFAKSAYPLYEDVISPSYLRSSSNFVTSPFIRSEIPAYNSEFIPALKFPLVKSFASYEPVVHARSPYHALSYPLPISSVPVGAAPIAATPIAASPIIDPVEHELRGFPVYHRGFPGVYPSYPTPAFRFPVPLIPSPIAPVPVAGVPASSASSTASASSVAGAGVPTIL